jgi:hypothetical protein
MPGERIKQDRNGKKVLISVSDLGIVSGFHIDL